MKRIFLLLLLEIMVLSLNGQHLPAKYQDLMRRVSEINSDSSSSKVTLSNEEFRPEAQTGAENLQDTSSSIRSRK